MSVLFSLLPFIFATTVLAQYWPNDDHMELELVQVLFRHGERTPLDGEYAILHDTDVAVYEPYGLGQLTENGKKQAYKIGQMLRRRYDGFLNETYKREDIFAQSVESDRIQNSLQLVLAGLYSSDLQNVEWNPKLNWSPIPYRSSPEKLDVLFRLFNSKKYKQLLHQTIISTPLAEELEKFSYLRDFIQSRPGVTLNRTVDLIALATILKIHSRLNISLPTWYSDDLMSKLADFEILGFDGMSYTAELRRIIAGPLIKTFIDRMNLMGATRNPRKMYLYSASDFNVAAVARALQVDGFRQVDFAGTIILEKLRDVYGQLYVRVLEWDAINEKLTGRKMKNCGDFCDIDDVLKICGDVIPSREEMSHMLDDFQARDIIDFYVDDPLVVGEK